MTNGIKPKSDPRHGSRRGAGPLMRDLAEAEREVGYDLRRDMVDLQNAKILRACLKGPRLWRRLALTAAIIRLVIAVNRKKKLLAEIRDAISAQKSTKYPTI